MHLSEVKHELLPSGTARFILTFPVRDRDPASRILSAETMPVIIHPGFLFEDLGSIKFFKTHECNQLSSHHRPSRCDR